MDRESNQPRGRSARGAQHLRDISHLYLSGARSTNATSAETRSCFRLGLVSLGDTLAKVDLCANLALQYARLGRRTLVVDLDDALPNVGFRMGLPAALFLSHLSQNAAARVERAALGVRLLEGVACSGSAQFDEAIRSEWRQAECLLVNLPTDPLRLQWLRSAQSAEPSEGAAEAATARPSPSAAAPRGAARRAALGRTTMARAGAASRMFGAWLETARRAPSTPDGVVRQPLGPLDAVLFVLESVREPSRIHTLVETWRQALDPAPVHLIQIGVSMHPAESPEPPTNPWARLPAMPGCATQRQPATLLYPEHEVSKRLEGLAQSLLARTGSRGGSHARLE